MIIVLKSGATEADVADVERRIRTMGYTPHIIHGELRNVIGAIGDDRGKERLRALESLECVESVTPILQPFKLASREVSDRPRRSMVGDVAIGGRDIAVMAGPCSVESDASRSWTRACGVKAAGARMLRGGAFKPRTSPYSFQGLGDEGLKLLRRGARGDRAAGRHRGDGRRTTSSWSPSTPTCSRSARATCRTSRCCSACGETPASRCCSSAACPTSIEEWLLAAEYVAGRRQPQRDPVRARHPHLRDRHAQHARSQRRAGAQAADASAGGRRPQPRHRALGVRW